MLPPLAAGVAALSQLIVIHSAFQTEPRDNTLSVFIQRHCPQWQVHFAAWHLK